MLAEFTVLEIASVPGRLQFSIQIPSGADDDSWVSCGAVDIEEGATIREIFIETNSEFASMIDEEYPGDSQAASEEGDTLLRSVLGILRLTYSSMFEPLVRVFYQNPEQTFVAVYDSVENRLTSLDAG